MSGRLAVESDTKNGSAAFFLANPEDYRARPREMLVPRRAQLRDSETGSVTEVTVIQAEEYFPGSKSNPQTMECLIGFRTDDGGIGVCQDSELTWLDAHAGDSA